MSYLEIAVQVDLNNLVLVHHSYHRRHCDDELMKSWCNNDKLIELLAVGHCLLGSRKAKSFV